MTNEQKQLVENYIRQKVKKVLIEFKKSKKKPLLEYLVREGDSLDAIGSLNLFSDFTEGQLISQYEDDFSESEDWMQIEKKYSKIANLLWNIIEKNKKITLTDDDVELVERSWYDGSDSYQDPEMACEYLPEVYDEQIKVVRSILKNHGIR